MIIDVVGVVINVVVVVELRLLVRWRLKRRMDTFRIKLVILDNQQESIEFQIKTHNEQKRGLKLR